MIKTTQPIVSIDWLSDHLDDPDLVILDASIKKVGNPTESNYSGIKIKNAVFFDIKNSFSDKTNEIPNMLPSEEVFTESCRSLGICSHNKIVVYDNLGIYSSPRVWWMFKTMGYTNVAILDGGLPAWKNVNLPCEPIDNSLLDAKKGNFKAKHVPELVTNAKTLLKEIYSTDSITIDARSIGRFKGIDPEPRKNLKGGHIPNSVNLPYKNVLKKGKMLPTNELRNIFTNINVKNKKMIFTCGSGISASILFLAAELAGFHNISIYDGSWSEWGQLENVPIEV